MKIYLFKELISLFINKTWESGIAEEVDYWDRYLRTGGGNYPEDFQMRTNPNAPLQDHIIDVLDFPTQAELHILDVGAGPLTYIGKQWLDKKVTITAIDPLAANYDELLQKYGITPLVRTQLGDAEKLTTYFPENTFDLGHARNAIDHCYDPNLAIQQMVAAVKPRGVVYLHHAVNEAKTRRYRGFHQWNLSASQGELYIGNAKQTINISKSLAAVAEVKNQLWADDTWLVTQIHKR